MFTFAKKVLFPPAAAFPARRVLRCENSKKLCENYERPFQNKPGNLFEWRHQKKSLMERYEFIKDNGRYGGFYKKNNIVCKEGAR